MDPETIGRTSNIGCYWLRTIRFILSLLYHKIYIGKPENNRPSAETLVPTMKSAEDTGEEHSVDADDWQQIQAASEKNKPESQSPVRKDDQLKKLLTVHSSPPSSERISNSILRSLLDSRLKAHMRPM